MNAASEDIKDMLVAESLSLTFATNLFIGREPKEPDNCVTIFDTPSRGPQLTLDETCQDYYYNSIQIRVRNKVYLTGETLIKNIVVALHGRAQETWNGTLYSLINCTNGPHHLDWDDNNRARFIANFNIQRR